MKKLLAVFYILLGGVAIAALPKVWVYGETLTSTDLNADFAYLYSNMVGAGFRLITANDISPDAGIVGTQLSNNAAITRGQVGDSQLWPDAIAGMNATCTTGTCALTQAQHIIQVAHMDAGVYAVTLDWNPAANTFTSFASPGVTTLSGTITCNPLLQQTTLPHLWIRCVNNAGAFTDTAVNFEVFDTGH